MIPSLEMKEAPPVWAALLSSKGKLAAQPIDEVEKGSGKIRSLLVMGNISYLK